MTTRIVRYQPTDLETWNRFVKESKNATFLLDRGYLEYHADRFEDQSRLVWEDQELVALLPLSLRDSKLSSHGGLTYGGFIVNQRMSCARLLDVFQHTRQHLLEAGFRTLTYKPIPHVYHRLPAEEDLYALFREGARLVRRDAATALSRDQRAPLTKGRKWSIGKALKAEHRVERSFDFAEFIELENKNLAARHGTSATHTAAELTLLATRFPDNIKLWVVRVGTRVEAGVVVYETHTVAHTQYIASSPEGRDAFALDAIIHFLLTTEYAQKSWFDFGISTESGGRVLNGNLANNKESWGGRTVTYDWYEWNLTERVE